MHFLHPTGVGMGGVNGVGAAGAGLVAAVGTAAVVAAAVVAAAAAVVAAAVVAVAAATAFLGGIPSTPEKHQFGEISETKKEREPCENHTK